MRNCLLNTFVWSMNIVCILALAASADAVTLSFNRNVEMNDGGNTGIPNRPFFTAGGPDGYVGTAVSGGTDTISTVTNPNVGVGGNSTFNDPGNLLPMGVGVNFGVSFMVETGDPSHFLSDGGNPGLGINSGGSDTNTNELSAGEQLFFSNIQVTNFSIQDPLGLLQPGATLGTPQWSALRSATFAAPTDFASTSSDSGVTTDVKMFDDVTNSINNNYTDGTFGPLAAVYVTTTGGNWPLKGIRYQWDFTYELAPVPASRRTFQFGENPQPGTYEGQVSHQLTDIGNQDTTISITAVGNSALLDTNSLGVGVNSPDDDLTDGIATGNNQQRFINGTLPNPEAIHFSFDRDVSLESLTLGNLSLDGTEGVVLGFVSGTNPFTGLTGYAGDYTLGADSITFNTSSGGQTPYTITYGKNGQDEVIVAAGTVLSLTSNPAFDHGFILDMITVNLLSVPELEGDYNGDGTVDAADYVVWRKTGINGQQGYDTWRANIGESAGGSAHSSAAVPEPGSAALAVLGILAAVACYCRPIEP